jgi:hypothetical protein
MSMTSELQVLERLLNRGAFDGVAFALTCENGFEPHGRASETWETLWRLVLPDVPAHWWHMREGWKPCTGNAVPMQFRGRTPGDVVTAAVAFLRESGAKQQLAAAAREPK